MATTPRTLLLTGAAGAAARALRPILRASGHELVLLDVVDPDAVDGERAVVADVGSVKAVREAARDADAIAHLGGVSGEAPWPVLAHANIDGTRSVLEAAVAAGVRRVLLASSTHVVGMHPVPTTRATDLPIRPDSYYGVSKVAMEALGALYADRHGLAVTTARIGTIEARPSNARSLATWLSHGDLARLVEAAAARDDAGSRIVWGVSRNTRRWCSLAPGIAMGFDPVDDAEVHAAGLVDVVHPLIGAAFADHELGVAR